MRATLRTVDSPPPDEYLKSSGSFLDAWSEVQEVCPANLGSLLDDNNSVDDQIPPIPFFTPNQEDYFVEQYGKQGFKYSKFYVFMSRLVSLNTRLSITILYA